MAEISLVKEWCDKEGLDQPTYSVNGFGTNWVCTARAEWLDQNIMSENCTNKKLAKQDAAKQLWLKIGVLKQQHFTIKKKTKVLMDGDQRMDCWSYLANKDISWENMDVTAFVNPTSHTLECPDIEIVKSKTTSKDSADALILITLGQLLSSDYERFLIVSQDHILVQAAMDTELVDWVSNVKDLKKYLLKN